MHTLTPNYLLLHDFSGNLHCFDVREVGEGLSSNESIFFFGRSKFNSDSSIKEEIHLWNFQLIANDRLVTKFSIPSHHAIGFIACALCYAGALNCFIALC